MENEGKSKLQKIKDNNYIFYLICSFTWGISTISEQAIQFFLKDDLKVEPAKLLLLHSFINFPWTLKIFYGLLTDLKPLFGYRRKSYLVILGLIQIICCLLMSFYATSTFQTTIILFIKTICLPFISFIF